MKETLTRPWQWLFTLMATYFIYVLVIVLIPFGLIQSASVKLLIQALAFLFFLFLLSKAMKRLGFSILRLINPDGYFDIKKLFKSFGLYLLALAIFSLFRYLLNPDAFHLTENYHLFTWLLPVTLLYTPLQVLFEEVVYHSYLSRFFQDDLPNESTKKIIIYSIVISILFAIMHMKNPEFQWETFTFNWPDFLFFLHTFSFYFIFSFYLMFISLKIGSFEMAIGIHWANNLFIDFFVGYQTSVVTRMPVLFRTDSVQYLVLTELIFCLAFVTLFIRKDLQKTN